MWLRTEVRECPDCRARTPHSSRLVSGPALVAAVATGLVVSAAAMTGSLVLLGLGALFVPLVRVSSGERRWRIACERCRTHAWVDDRRRAPKLDGSTVFYVS